MTPLYKDSSRSIETRVADLLAKMSIEEKIAQMHAFWLILSEDGEHQPRYDSFTGSTDASALRQRMANGLGQISRPLGSHSVEPQKGVRALNTLQKFLCEQTRLGIPVMSHEETLVGLMVQGGTLFPSALAYGATWNPTLIERVGDAIGREARSVGCHQALAPVLDVSRDVRWGRTEETFGEDPYLIGVMATRYVRGLQGPKRDLLATLKHYVGHSASEGARNHAPVSIGRRELNDIFMLPFEMAVKLANAGSVMPAYHDIDNEPCHGSRHLLTEVLRDQWGFDGLVVADYVGISLLFQHHGIAADAAEAAAIAFNAGLDVELPGNDCASQLQAALDRGQIDIATIDSIVSRILTEKFRLGLFEQPYADENGISLRTAETVALSREVACQSIVVLENKGVLPIAPEKAKKIAVIGPTSDDPLALLGGYSFPVHLILSDMEASTDSVITPLAALKETFGNDKIIAAKGCQVLGKRQAGSPVFPGDVADNTNLDHKSPVLHDTSLIPAAVEAARQAEIAIVCVGDLAGLFQTGTVGEGSDTDTLVLPGAQQQLVEAVVATGTPTVVVVYSGRPYSLGDVEAKLAAYVMAFAGGQEGGAALADVLSGAREPSGRLTVSVPKSVGAVPYYYNHKFKSSGTPIAFHFGSRYPFGHGLAYTTFEYSDLELENTTLPIENGDVVVSFNIRNTGKRNGIAVPQLYVRDVLASSVRPVKELKAFERIEIAAGQTTRVTFTVPVDMLNFTNPDGQRIVEPGVFDIQIGSSSTHIHLKASVTVEGATRLLSRNWRMESKASIA
ncbi:MAG: glycoside hydrolase family 3 C-terminal domain-containing protein [Uliginosibacterium sp.]|nr:glycoside hydrolase family 3 C-terminal domain-containing protein [Uliginosibacterium sp.]